MWFRFAWVECVLSNIELCAEARQTSVSRCSVSQAEHLMILILKLRALLTGRVWQSKFSRYATIVDISGERCDGAYLPSPFVMSSSDRRAHCTLTGAGARRFVRFYSGQDETEDGGDVMQSAELTLWRDLANVESPSQLSDALNEAAIPSCAWRCITRRAARRADTSAWTTSARLRATYENISVRIVICFQHF